MPSPKAHIIEPITMLTTSFMRVPAPTAPKKNLACRKRRTPVTESRRRGERHQGSHVTDVADVADVADAADAADVTKVPYVTDVTDAKILP